MRKGRRGEEGRGSGERMREEKREEGKEKRRKNSGTSESYVASTSRRAHTCTHQIKTGHKIIYCKSEF